VLSSIILQGTSSIDAEAASSYFESLEDYLKSLRLFIQTHQTTDKKITVAIEKQDGTAFRCCHTLKGVSRLIGATKLETYCLQLENLISEKADLKNHLLLAQIESELSLVLADVNKILDKAEKAYSPVSQDSSSKQEGINQEGIDIDMEQFSQLYYLITQYDTQAIDLTEKLIAINAVNTEVANQLSEVLSYLNQFNYEQAGKLLANLKPAK